MNTLRDICLKVLMDLGCNDPFYLNIQAKLDQEYTNLLKEAFPEETFSYNTEVLRWMCEFYELL